ncbi:MAG: tetratricopeptide repeat protein, partial [Anaerolineales bacterium]|nr:tetratricopeptide repeat protein [Anaerolineales bacterium]
KRVRETFHPHAVFDAAWLQAVGSKHILTRMLNNLKGLFVQRQDIRRVQQIVDKILILEPRAGNEIREMGLLSLRLGAYRQAATYLERYLLAHADAADADMVRGYLRFALDQVERLN